MVVDFSPFDWNGEKIFFGIDCLVLIVLFGLVWFGLVWFTVEKCCRFVKCCCLVKGYYWLWDCIVGVYSGTV